jgi:hypothetical protein
MAESHHELRDALGRLVDANDGVPVPGTVAPEDLWSLVKFHLAPVADQLGNDLRRFSSGAWTLDIYILEAVGPWATWHDISPAWHEKWAGYGKCRVAQFYAPNHTTLQLSIPGKPLVDFSYIDPDTVTLRQLIERATAILQNGLAGKSFA